MFTLYPEYESDDEDISIAKKDFPDINDVEHFTARVENIGVDSDAAELEGVIARGEQLVQQARNGEGDDDQTVSRFSLPVVRYAYHPARRSWWPWKSIWATSGNAWTTTTA